MKTPVYEVRVRAAAPDPFSGLRGHDYIQARGLAPQVKIGRVPPVLGECSCVPCKQARLLPAILRICDAFDRRREQLPDHPGRRWNDQDDEATLELLSCCCEGGH